jgi:hypothetical protein
MCVSDLDRARAGAATVEIQWLALGVSPSGYNPMVYTTVDRVYIPCTCCVYCAFLCYMSVLDYIRLLSGRGPILSCRCG